MKRLSRNIYEKPRLASTKAIKEKERFDLLKKYRNVTAENKG